MESHKSNVPNHQPVIDDIDGPFHPMSMLQDSQGCWRSSQRNHKNQKGHSPRCSKCHTCSCRNLGAWCNVWMSPRKFMCVFWRLSAEGVFQSYKNDWIYIYTHDKYMFLFIFLVHLNIRTFKYKNRYFRLPPGRFFPWPARPSKHTESNSFKHTITTMWGPPVISWFISPSNYSYKYHKL